MKWSYAHSLFDSWRYTTYILGSIRVLKSNFGLTIHTKRCHVFVDEIQNDLCTSHQAFDLVDEATKLLAIVIFFLVLSFIKKTTVHDLNTIHDEINATLQNIILCLDFEDEHLKDLIHKFYELRLFNFDLVWREFQDVDKHLKVQGAIIACQCIHQIHDFKKNFKKIALSSQEPWCLLFN